MGKMLFKPKFEITTKIVHELMRIEAAKTAILSLPITLSIQRRLLESAKLLSTHYSTFIEGNRLTLKEAEGVIRKKQHFPGKERDEKEVLGYYKALDFVEDLAVTETALKEAQIQQIHALVMGKSGKRPTPYRDGQNVIRNSRSGGIVYLPPEAKDVPKLMHELVQWIGAKEKDVPCPIVAGIAHYQFATIHPYYDGNGRTARLLTTLLLFRGGYDLKGFYSLEEYYGRDLKGYYSALAVGKSHNYYEGRVESDISGWIEYFCRGMANSFEAVKQRAETELSEGKKDASPLLRSLGPRERKLLTLFEDRDAIAASDVGTLFGIKPRTARLLCQQWTEEGLLTVENSAKKNRTYTLHRKFKSLRP